jgi:ATP-binding cassette subfamily C exporter for protease/lipase
MNPLSPRPGEAGPLRQALDAQRPLFQRAAAFSVVTGLMALTPSWFMFEVYGRVLNSRNERTLWMLFLAVLAAYAVMELLDLVRSRILRQAADRVDARLREQAFDLIFAANLRKPGASSHQVFTDLRLLRDFIPSQPVTATMDLPAAVICLGLLFLMGPWLGVAALIGAGLQMAVAWSTEKRTMPLLTEATKASIGAQAYAGSTMRNAQVIEAMGMVGHIHKRWSERQRHFLALQTRASDVGGLNAVIAKVLQQMQGSVLLGLAALLVLTNDLWGGAAMMIVASILGARVLQPLTQLVSQWRQVVLVRDAWKRLDALFASPLPPEPGMPLPPPKGQLSVEQVVATPPAGGMPILKGASFTALPGEVVAVVGPSASGKTTLARLLVGVWPASAGKVRLDGVDVFGWHKSELGPHVGYLPQAVELFDGTVAENVARFGAVDRDKVQRAVDMVGLADTLQALPQGLDTRIGDEGAVLSGGQRQRLALARALYGDPQLVVLDEPNASLDEAGDRMLVQLLGALKSRGATTIVITHRTTLLPAVDKMVVLREGQVAMAGPRDEVLGAMKKAADQARAKAAPALAAQPRGAGA